MRKESIPIGPRGVAEGQTMGERQRATSAGQLPFELVSGFANSIELLFLPKSNELLTGDGSLAPSRNALLNRSVPDAGSRLLPSAQQPRLGRHQQPDQFRPYGMGIV